MTKVLVIVNPISGTRDKTPIVESLPRYLDAERFQYRVVWTQHSGHAAELARQAVAEGYDVCLAIGGDGTVNEVARSLCHTPTALAIVPMGSGNGLARHLRIPMDPDGALRVLAECQIHELDYGTINGHPFFCTCGLGFDAFLSEKFATSGRRGMRTYMQRALDVGINYKPETYDIEVDGRSEHLKAFLITCGNASQYGNNFYITPTASMHDGLLDVTILEPFPLIESAQVVLQMLNKTISSNPHSRMFQCQSLRVHRSKPGVIHYDGDPAEAGTDIEIGLQPKGIRIVVNPAKKDHKAVVNTLQDLFDQITGDIKAQRRKLLASKIFR